MFINITIKSKNKNSLEKFLNFFYEFSNNSKLKLNRSLFLSQKKKYNKIFTVLKSPHVNKTAQEQFEFILFSKSVKVDTFQTLKTLIVFKKIQSTFLSEIKIKINFNINLKRKKDIVIGKFKPNNVVLNENCKPHFKQIELYLLLFNFYGKYKFL